MSAWTEYMDQLVGVHTAKAVAQKVGVDSSQISRWRNGRSIPSVENVIRLAEAYKGNVAEAMVAAGYIDAGTYAEFPSDLDAEDGPASKLERDPFASISVPKLLKYIAHVVVQCGRIKAAAPNIDREISLAAIEIDSLSSGMLLSVLAGSERPVPDHLVASVEALTQYIYGPGEMVDILGLFSRMLQDEPGAHDEAMRLLADKHTTHQDRTDKGVSDDLEAASQPSASPEGDEIEEVMYPNRSDLEVDFNPGDYGLAARRVTDEDKPQRPMDS
ncbi:helix-turn-helix domain-containing protein [Mycobacteroides abscessus]|uniref:helix-turn-helix domain-containing protein n=1 Tax=Mycobacteroides abscessus TaxID=36809 RepID=UPI00232EB979|nr:helix-turn-helix transcriptional regulator [Mycobacteroides abscessus]MDB2222338.1 helix-turn-helix transcriptional regulator [Mycobacteroides abscessus subsp. abscessus]